MIYMIDIDITVSNNNSTGKTYVLPATPREHSLGSKKTVAGVRILGIGEVVCFSCLGVGSLTELPLKPETLNPKT